MAETATNKRRFFVKHVRSCVTNEDGSPKLPTADQIEYGEIAINYAKDKETISLKNENNEIVSLTLKEAGKIDDVQVDGTSVVENKIAKISHKISDNYTQATYAEPFATKVSGSRVATGDTFEGAFNKVETTISTLVDEVLDNEVVTSNGIAKLAEATGTLKDDDSIGYVVETNANYISNAISVHDATVILDDALKAVRNDVDTKFSTAGGTMTGALTVEDDVTAVAYYTNSDEKIKENVKAINNSSIARVADVSLKEYNLIEDNNKTTRYGVIAQDLEKVGLNNLVSVDKDGVKSVDYISFLILKIQQLESKINELKK